MADVVAARNAYLAARKLVAETKLALGKAIIDARARRVPQEDIARELKLTREQIRRYQIDYRKAVAKAAAAANGP